MSKMENESCLHRREKFILGIIKEELELLAYYKKSLLMKNSTFLFISRPIFTLNPEQSTPFHIPSTISFAIGRL